MKVRTLPFTLIARNPAMVAVVLILAPVALQAQTTVAPAFQGAITDIRTIAVAAGTLVAGLVGLVGLGRTAYKLSQGDTDSMTALIFAIVGIVLGFLANTFIA
ncbi:MAG: hypothetical protein L0387_42590 [Acidobacteria bacterium]|nr:hypothetical protein [Acidobacteriota bacterium]MCI0722002.1 hypothetical protein [Acidobacteriota bacterium]